MLCTQRAHKIESNAAAGQPGLYWSHKKERRETLCLIGLSSAITPSASLQRKKIMFSNNASIMAVNVILKQLVLFLITDILLCKKNSLCVVMNFR